MFSIKEKSLPLFRQALLLYYTLINEGKNSFPALIIINKKEIQTNILPESP